MEILSEWFRYKGEGQGTPKYYLVNTYRWDRHLDVRAGFMKKSKKQLQEKVLAELANGELVTALCRRDDMPPLSTLQRWRRVDTEFDDRCWSAEAQGVMIKRSAYIEQIATLCPESSANCIP